MAHKNLILGIRRFLPFVCSGEKIVITARMASEKEAVSGAFIE
jgi:hypothetical protein